MTDRILMVVVVTSLLLLVAVLCAVTGIAVFDPSAFETAVIISGGSCGA